MSKTNFPESPTPPADEFAETPAESEARQNAADPSVATSTRNYPVDPRAVGMQNDPTRGLTVGSADAPVPQYSPGDPRVAPALTRNYPADPRLAADLARPAGAVRADYPAGDPRNAPTNYPNDPRAVGSQVDPTHGDVTGYPTTSTAFSATHELVRKSGHVQRVRMEGGKPVTESGTVADLLDGDVVRPRTSRYPGDLTGNPGDHRDAYGVARPGDQFNPGPNQGGYRDDTGRAGRPGEQFNPGPYPGESTVNPGSTGLTTENGMPRTVNQTAPFPGFPADGRLREAIRLIQAVIDETGGVGSGFAATHEVVQAVRMENGQPVTESGAPAARLEGDVVRRVLPR